jgi:hypothetical protein
MGSAFGQKVRARLDTAIQRAIKVSVIYLYGAKQGKRSEYLPQWAENGYIVLT